MIELMFKLEQDEDDWPPVGAEGLWCQPVNSLYRVETCPLFVKGISVGDLIEAEADEDGRVFQFTVAEPSANSTVWLIFWDRSAINPTLQALRSLGCDTTGPPEGTDAKICSVNVPANVDFTKVDAVLQPLEQPERIAVAYPSYRHTDG